MSRPFTALVINPFITDFKLYDEWMHPLGLYFLIDMLTANGISVYYFNCLERLTGDPLKKYGTGRFAGREIPRPACFRNIKRKYKLYGCSSQRFHAYLRGLPPIDVVFIGSMMTYWAEGIIETVRLIREVYSDVPIVCGGIAVRLMPGYFRKALPEVRLFTGPLFGSSTSLMLPGIPQPLTMPKEFSSVAGLKKAGQRFHGPLLLSLGCPMRCTYCASNLLQPEYRRRSIDTVWEEVSFCVTEHGIRDFALYDDALLVDAESLFVPLLDRIITRRFTIRIHTPNGMHLKYITGPLLELMRKAGMVTLRFGYESGNTRHRHRTGGKADWKLLEETLPLVRQFDFPDAGVYVMGGLPGSTAEEMVDEMRLIASFGIAVKPVFVSPVPGTELYREYAATFPELLTEPCLHNDTYFTVKLPGWGEAGVEMVRQWAKKLNRR